MFLHTLILLIIFDPSTLASQQTPAASTLTPLDEVPPFSSSLTEGNIDNELQTGDSSTKHKADNEQERSPAVHTAPHLVAKSTAEAEEIVLKADDDPTYKHLLSGMMIHHCHCPGGQVLTWSGCMPFNTTVTIFDSTKFSPRTIPTSLLAGRVTALHCGQGLGPMVLPDGSFALLPGGALLIPSVGMFYTRGHYCVSHIYSRGGKIQPGKEGEQPWMEEKHVSWRAKVCIKNPIRRCCGLNSQNITSGTTNGLNVNESECSIQQSSSRPNDTSSFFTLENYTLSSNRTEATRPVVMFRSDAVDWDYEQALPVHLNCSLGKHTVELVNNDNLHLSYSREGSILTWAIHKNIHIVFWHDEFCINRRGTEGNYKYLTMFCHSEENNSSGQEVVQSPPYVRKCCSENTVYNVQDKRCESSKQMWIDNLYKDVQWDLLSGFYYNLEDDDSTVASGAHDDSSAVHDTNDSLNDPLEYEEPFIDLARIPLMWGFPSCSWHDINITAGDFMLLANGSVLVHNDTIDPSLFCFETFVSSEGQNSSTSVRTLVVCDPLEPFGGVCSWATSLLVPLMGVSCGFMALTLLVFLSVPDLTDRVSSRCLVSEIVALLVSFLLLIVAHTWQSIYGTVYCVLLGTLSHSAALASFFWLNAICVEVWITIRRVNPEPRVQGHRRFAAYCVWGWGAPAAIALLGALADVLPPSHGLLRPQTAVACFPNKDNRSAHWAYVYAPMAALLCVNLCLFVHLSITIVQTTRQAARMRGRAPSEDAAHYWNKMKTYLKLFLVMGVSWTAEVLSFQFKSCGVWIFTDSFNALRGVFIFFIFAFKAEVLEKVRKNAKNRWSLITGRASQVLTAVRGRQVTQSRTFGKGVQTSGSSSGTVNLSVLSPTVTPRSRRGTGTPASTPTSYTSVPPEFPTVNPPFPHLEANGLDLTNPNVYVVDELSWRLSTDQNNENHQQTEDFSSPDRFPSAMTVSLRTSSMNGRGASYRPSSSSKVGPLLQFPSSCERETLRCPLSQLSTGSSAQSKLLHTRSSPSLQCLNNTGLDAWGTNDTSEASPRRVLSTYSRHMNRDES